MSDFSVNNAGDVVTESQGSACCPAHFLLGLIEQAMTEPDFPDETTVVTQSFQSLSAAEVAKMLNDAVTRVAGRLGSIKFVPNQESPFSTDGYAKA